MTANKTRHAIGARPRRSAQEQPLKFCRIFSQSEPGSLASAYSCAVRERFSVRRCNIRWVFLANGTLVFGSNTRVNDEKVLKRARAVLEEFNGFQEPAFLRELDYLAELVRRDPFSSIDHAMVFEICVTFLDKRLKLSADPPSANGKKDVRAVEYTPSEFMSAVYKLGSSPCPHTQVRQPSPSRRARSVSAEACA
jgi:hypothetical protein